jgi:hypothetical protein
MVDVPAGFQHHKTVFVGTREHGLFRSRDEGLHFTMILPSASPIFSVASSPEFVRDECVFVGVQNGVLRSTDGGESWKPLSALSIVAPRLAVSPRFAADGTAFAASLSGLYRTGDGGDSWQQLCLAGSGDIIAIDGIAVSPMFGSDGCVIVNARGAGPWRSLDGGDSFHPLTNDDVSALHFSHLTGFPDFVSLMAFAGDGTLYASTMYELFRSEDKGESWKLMPRPVRYEETKQVRYEGHWRFERDDAYSSGGASISAAPGARALLNFWGTRVRWLGTRGPDHGMARVEIDGQELATVDLYSPVRESQCVLYESPELEPGLRSITITVAGKRHEYASGLRVCVDAFDIGPFAHRSSRDG